MTTETGPDLTFAQQALTSLMDDTCTIHDVPNVPDGTLNEDTLVIENSTAPTLVYTGACKVRPASAALLARISEEGGRKQRTSIYQAAIPHDSVKPSPGQVLKMTGSRRNAALVNREFRITEVLLSTFHLQWSMVCELREGE